MHLMAGLPAEGTTIHKRMHQSCRLFSLKRANIPQITHTHTVIITIIVLRTTIMVRSGPQMHIVFLECNHLTLVR